MTKEELEVKSKDELIAIIQEYETKLSTSESLYRYVSKINDDMRKVIDASILLFNSVRK